MGYPWNSPEGCWVSCLLPGVSGKGARSRGGGRPGAGRPPGPPSAHRPALGSHVRGQRVERQALRWPWLPRNQLPSGFPSFSRPLAGGAIPTLVSGGSQRLGPRLSSWLSRVGRRQQGSPREPQVLRRSLLLYPAAASPPARQDQCRPGAEREERRPGWGVSGCLRQGRSDAGPQASCPTTSPSEPPLGSPGGRSTPQAAGVPQDCRPLVPCASPPPTPANLGGMSGLHAPGTPPGTPTFCLRLIKPGQISQHSEGLARIWGQRPFLSSTRPLLLGLSSAGPSPGPPGARG